MTAEILKQRTIADLRSRLQRGNHHDSHSPPDENPQAEAWDWKRVCSISQTGPGRLLEWIGDTGSGAGTLSLYSACRKPTPERPAIVIDPQSQVYPLPLWAMGCDPAAWIFLRGIPEAEALWALEQALRCEAVSVVWCKLETLSPVAFRRLQLAVESSGTLGMLVRPTAASQHPSWADLRLIVQPELSPDTQPRFVVRTHSRHGQIRQGDFRVEWNRLHHTFSEISRDDSPHSVSLVS